MKPSSYIMLFILFPLWGLVTITGLPFAILSAIYELMLKLQGLISEQIDRHLNT